MEGIIQEARELIDENPDEEVLDAGLISAAQHVEHYEMAGYGTVRSYAELLDEPRQADLLQETLDEEGEADKLLTRLANGINIDAEGEDDESEDEDEEVVMPAKRGSRTARSVRS